jgi:hypothetical protein
MGLGKFATIALVLALPTTSAYAVDDECDAFGSPAGLEDLSNADIVVDGASNYDYAGGAVVLTDLNGDGIDDLVVGVPGDDTAAPAAGAVYIYYGPIEPSDVTLPINMEASDTDADVVILGSGPNEYLGWAVDAAGDIDGDEYNDLVIGAPAFLFSNYPAGYAVLISGGENLDPVIQVEDGAALLVGENSGDDFGHAVSGMDVQGDGFGDVIVGAPYNDEAGADAGSVYAFLGPMDGLLEAGRDDDGHFTGSTSARAGWSLANLGDFSGDGFDDLAIGAYRDTTGGTSAGAVHVVFGNQFLPSPLPLVDADVVITGGYNDRVGASVSSAGDLDGDGTNDLLFGASTHWALGVGLFNSGAAYVVAGGQASGSNLLSRTDSDITIIGATANATAGSAVASGDFNGDGEGDLLIGSEKATTLNGFQTGSAHVVLGPLVVGDLLKLDTESDFSVQGGSFWAYTGARVASGDLNNDGYDDMVVAGWSENIGLASNGQTGIFLGGSDDVDVRRFYADTDGDGFGDSAVFEEACDTPLVGVWVENADDCDDARDDIYPGAPELACDGVDYNCDGVVGDPGVDSDLDGFAACEECDDDDADINPDADELCGDGIDNNCDGLVDDPSATNADIYYIDLDLDGYGNDAIPLPGCEEPTGFLVDLTLIGGDCNDGDDDINPDAFEYCDLVDNNCDGNIDEAGALGEAAWYADTDGDGFGDYENSISSCDEPGGYTADFYDCDDSDPLVYPGADEICDYKDNDCDGIYYAGGPMEVDDSRMTMNGSDVEGEFGWAVAWIDDQDGDGFDEVAVGAPKDDSGGVQAGGAVYVFSGDDDGGTFNVDNVRADGARDYTARILMTNRSDSFLGYALASADFTGDGVADLAVGAYGYSDSSAERGAVAIFHGPVVGELNFLDADATYVGELNSYAGFALDTADFDGDGQADLLIGAPHYDSDPSDSLVRFGAGLVMYGPLDNLGEMDLVSEADAFLVGT